MDGRVLKEIFKPDSEIAGRDISYYEETLKDELHRRIKRLKKKHRARGL